MSKKHRCFVCTRDCPHKGTKKCKKCPYNTQECKDCLLESVMGTTRCEYVRKSLREQKLKGFAERLIGKDKVTILTSRQCIQTILDNNLPDVDPATKRHICRSIVRALESLKIVVKETTDDIKQT